MLFFPSVYFVDLWNGVQPYTKHQVQYSGVPITYQENLGTFRNGYSIHALSLFSKMFFQNLFKMSI